MLLNLTPLVLIYVKPHMAQICSDFMKNKVPSKVIIQNAIKAFNLLQNCIQLNKMEDVWQMIVVVFSYRYKTKHMKESIKRFQEMPEKVEELSPDEDQCKIFLYKVCTVKLLKSLYNSYKIIHCMCKVVLLHIWFVQNHGCQ